MAFAYRGAEDTLKATLAELQWRASQLGRRVDRARLDPSQATVVSVRWRAALDSLCDLAGLGDVDALERACSAHRELVRAYEELLARSDAAEAK